MFGIGLEWIDYTHCQRANRPCNSWATPYSQCGTTQSIVDPSPKIADPACGLREVRRRYKDGSHILVTPRYAQLRNRDKMLVCWSPDHLQSKLSDVLFIPKASSKGTSGGWLLPDELFVGYMHKTLGATINKEEWQRFGVRRCARCPSSTWSNTLNISYSRFTCSSRFPLCTGIRRQVYPCWDSSSQRPTHFVSVCCIHLATWAKS